MATHGPKHNSQNSKEICAQTSLAQFAWSNNTATSKR